MINKPVILAIDNSSDYLSLALYYCGQYFEHHQYAAQKHTEYLLPSLEQLCQKAHCSRNELKHIAYNAGPAGFTGIRLSCTFAQGLAYANQGSIMPVISLDALYWFFTHNHARAMNIIADARIEQYYMAQYTQEGQRSGEMSLINYDEVFACADGGVLAPEHTKDMFSKNFQEVRPHARMILDYALNNPQAQWCQPLNAEVHYVRDKIAKTIEERQSC
jgi:tRNA threonylcarbamoyladenosine biosynthesis protein TsaB